MQQESKHLTLGLLPSVIFQVRSIQQETKYLTSGLLPSVIFCGPGLNWQQGQGITIGFNHKHKIMSKIV